MIKKVHLIVHSLLFFCRWSNPFACIVSLSLLTRSRAELNTITNEKLIKALSEERERERNAPTSANGIKERARRREKKDERRKKLEELRANQMKSSHTYWQNHRLPFNFSAIVTYFRSQFSRILDFSKQWNFHRIYSSLSLQPWCSFSNLHLQVSSVRSFIRGEHFLSLY